MLSRIVFSSVLNRQLILHMLTAVLLGSQGGETVDHIGAVRVFGVADSLLFEQLVQLDNTSMTM